MKKRLLLSLACILWVLPLVASFPAHHAWATQHTEAGSIIILHTNDVHTSIDKDISYAGVAAYKKQIQEKHGKDNVLLVDAGDAIQGGPVGALTRGSAIVELMNALGYDYMTLGNHEFDYGIPRLLELAKDLNTTIISCNVLHTKDNSTFFPPYAIKEIQGVKIAFVGITTPETLTKSVPTFFQDAAGKYIVSFAEGGKGMDLYNIVQKNVDAARAQGAHVVIALAHLGMDKESIPWDTPSVVANTSGIDAFIDGHSHTLLENTFYKNKEGKKVVITQTGSRLKALGKISIDPKTHALKAEIIKEIPEKDAATQELIASINDTLAHILEENVGESAVALQTRNAEGETIIRHQETNLGDLVTDAFRVALDADVAILNSGGIRASINQGPITFRNVIDILPFGTDAVSVQITGQTLLNALEMGAHSYPKPNGGFLQVSGMEYTIDPKVPSSVVLDDKGNFLKVSGPYRVKNVLIKGKPLDLKKNYSVAGIDYILRHGGDGMSMFEEAKVLKDKYMVDNEVLIVFIRDILGGKIGEDYAKAQGRIKILPAR